ncbi:hypothetical protein WJX73_002783 [Symbiochloris irregularis]|uniref:Protein kinase domain-containing protein n=1 Tax=Symbiochloris irregularis TaxID=706552 RepID=A0AAW1NPR0_9CHLO
MQNWPHAVMLNTTVFLQGDATNEHVRVLDWNNQINAIQLQSGAALGLQDLLVTGMPWDALNTNLTADFPVSPYNDMYPSVVFFPNSTLFVEDVQLEIEPSRYNLTCPDYDKAFARIINLAYVVASESTDDLSLTVYASNGSVSWPSAITTGNGTASLGNGTITLIGKTTFDCFETPAARPNTLGSAIAVDPLPSGFADAKAGPDHSKLDGEEIAGLVVGAVAAALLLAALGLFVLRKISDTAGSPQKPITAELVSAKSSTTVGAEPAKQQLMHPILQLEAAALESKKTSYTLESCELCDKADEPVRVGMQDCTLQFNWQIQPHRITVPGGRDAVPIGVGAYGIVYKGELDRFKPVAIKFLYSGACNAAASHAHFLGEISLLRACKDRNVVELKGAWAQQGLVYMVLELMGSDLLRALADEQLLVSKLPSTHRHLGWYDRGSSIALDILRGEPASYSADMWSFGVILLEIVTATLPERGNYATPEVPSDCPQTIAALIDGCMSTAPSDRPTALEAIQIITASRKKERKLHLEGIIV